MSRIEVGAKRGVGSLLGPTLLTNDAVSPKDPNVIN